MISTGNQVRLMFANLAILLVLYWLPFTDMPQIVAAVCAAMIPLQTLLWRVAYHRPSKDYFFCFSFLVLILLLKHFWQSTDLIFYAAAIVIGAIVPFRIFLAVAASGIALEVLREHHFAAEGAEEVAFRYLLFFVAGCLTSFLLREEKRLKERYKKQLDDLRYGIHQLGEIGQEGLSDPEQVSRSAEAAQALDESLNRFLLLLFDVFQPDAAAFWQLLPEKQHLRVRYSKGESQILQNDPVIRLGDGPVGWTAVNKKVYLQQDRSEGISYLPGKKKQIFGSFLAAPVLDQDRLEGVITLEAKKLNCFAPGIENSVASFASQMAEAIRMARLARDREERALEFQAFYKASKELSALIDANEIILKMHDLTSDIVSYDFSSIIVSERDENPFRLYFWPVDGDKRDLEKLELKRNEGSWICWFLQQREEPLILSSSQLQLQQMPLLWSGEDLDALSGFLIVPMRHQQKNIGALILGSRSAEHFNSHQARVLSILCNQTAVSLENAAIIQQMEELAITDGLTGLFNHRYFQESLQNELERAQRQEQKLSLLLMDIDHFKGLNDNFGHPAGDYVLRTLATVLKSNARKIDVLARYGGEEFAALLPGINIKNARKTAERWRKTIQKSVFQWDGRSFPVTMSVGFSTYPDDGENHTELFDKADRALYDAKEGGRNQVRHTGDADPFPRRIFG